MQIDRDKFFSGYRDKFGELRQSQVDGLNALLLAIEADAEMTDARWAAYLLATVKHECADTWQPIKERGGVDYLQRYEGRKDLGNTQIGDGVRFCGRGYCQITGRANYTKFSNLIGVDLVANPDLALQPETAYKIISVGMRQGLFTGKSLSDYLNSQKTDYTNARRIINALDKANLIAGYAILFEAILLDSAIQ